MSGKGKERSLGEDGAGSTADGDNEGDRSSSKDVQPTNSDVSLSDLSTMSAKERLAAFARRRLSEKLNGSSPNANGSRPNAIPRRRVSSAAAASSPSSSVKRSASTKQPTSSVSNRLEPLFSSNKPGSSSPAAPILRIEQRRQERARGAGTHAIESRNVNFPNLSPASTSSMISTPKVMKPPVSNANLEKRRQERMRGSGKHAIEKRHVDFPTQSPGSSLRATSEARSEASTEDQALQKTPTKAQQKASIEAPIQPQRETQVKSSALPLPTSGKTSEKGGPGKSKTSAEPEKSAKPTKAQEANINQNAGAVAESPSDLSTNTIPDMEQRKMERVRGSGTHAIERQRVQFPNPSPASSSILDSSQMPSSSPAFSARKDVEPSRATMQQTPSPAADRSELPASEQSIVIPNIDQRKLQRVRGAATHAIEPQRVQFPDQSPSASSVLDRIEESISEPSVIVPDIEKRRQERVKGAGVHPVQARTVDFTDQSPVPSIAASTFSSLVNTPAPAERPKGIDQRRQERARGAATHAIEPQRVQFQDQSPSSSSTLDRTEGPISEMSVVVPDIEKRRQERVRGAGVHPVQARIVGFPEQSPASTMMNDTSYFDNSFLDPALLDVSNNFGEYQYTQPEDDVMSGEDEAAPQPEDDQMIVEEPKDDQTMVEEPKESTPPAKQKRKRASKAKQVDISREASVATEDSTGQSKRRKKLQPPNDFDPKMRRAIDRPLPLWQNPRAYLTNEEKAEAQLQLADIMELCIRKGTAVGRKLSGPSDADVIYTVIKREFQKVAKTIPNHKKPFLSELLDELVVHFRELSQKHTTRHQLIKDLELAQQKKVSMRRIVHEQRGNVVEALRTLDGLKQQQESVIIKTKNDQRIASFLTDLRERYAPLWN